MRKNGSHLDEDAASRPDEENPEWTAEEMRNARPLLEVLPKELADALRRHQGQRGAQKRPTKELISLRVDRDVVAAYRATGRGWQSRANKALRAYAKSGLVTRARRPRQGQAKPRRPVAKHP
jgi:uncharacterized protein (DUF4415 family)